MNKEKITGIAIAVSGPADYFKGLIHNLPNFPKRHNVPLKDIIESKIELPVFVGKDNNASLFNFKWKNIFKNSNNVVYLVIMKGIGTAILLNGKIYRADSTAAGESFTGAVAVALSEGKHSDEAVEFWK